MSPLTERFARRGACLVLAGPSGVGKTAIAQQLLASDPGLRPSISATTRPPRPGEIDGVDYYFRSQEEFDALVTSGGMLEYATVFGRSYGTPRPPVDDALSRGLDVLFVIDWQGHRSLQAALPGDVVGVFLLPPSFDELEARLMSRGDKNQDVIRRTAEARSEASHRDEFDRVVVNDDLDVATDAVRTILEAARGQRMAYKL